jgi:serine/threonine protein kinase
MAIVYRARDVASGTAVALKRCLLPGDTPDADAAARHEADMHKRLSDHPNVVTLYGREITAVTMADKSRGIQASACALLSARSPSNNSSWAINQ